MIKFFCYMLSCIFFISVTFAQSTTAPRLTLRTISNTQYTEHTELFAEFKPVIQNTASRFTAHFTKIDKTFTAYTDAEVSFTMKVNGATTFQQIVKKPVEPGIYRFNVLSATSGTAEITINLSTKDYSEQFIIPSVEVYTDTANAITGQKNMSAKPPGLISYYKEKSWFTNFATEPVTLQGKKIIVPQTAVLTKDNETIVYVQYDTENFKKQIVKTGKSAKNKVVVKSGLTKDDRIIVIGAESIENK
jgi:hypothetical protein